MKHLALSIFVLLTPTLTASAQRVPDDWRVERDTLSGTVSEGIAVAVENSFGDVRVRGLPSNDYEVLVVAQRHADDPRRAQVVAEERDGTLHIEVQYPDEPPAEIPEAWRKRRVDLTVLVPAAATLELETRLGTIQAKGLEGDVEATSHTGNVQIVTAGRIRARSDHGKVQAEFRGTGWQRQPVLETLTGDIRVLLPRGARLQALVETRGEITTDYTIRIDRVAGSLLKRGEALIGGGGPELVLKSERGAVKLLESTWGD
jgi:hypothetical protein